MGFLALRYKTSLLKTVMNVYNEKSGQSWEPTRIMFCLADVNHSFLSLFLHLIKRVGSQIPPAKVALLLWGARPS